MKPLRFFKLAFAAAAVTLAWGVAPGCGPSVASYCNKVCDCQGCDDQQRESCVENVQLQQGTARDAGCATEWSDLFSCTNAEAECNDGYLSADGCDAERKALSDCGGGGVGTCYALCEAFQECDGGSPSDCKSSCDQQQQMIDASGCNGPWDDYVNCLLGADDLCNFSGDECLDAALTYSDCFSQYCNSNPNGVGCGGIEDGSGGAAGGAVGSGGVGGAGGSF